MRVQDERLFPPGVLGDVHQGADGAVLVQLKQIHRRIVVYDLHAPGAVLLLDGFRHREEAGVIGADQVSAGGVKADIGGAGAAGGDAGDLGQIPGGGIDLISVNQAAAAFSRSRDSL